MHLNKRLIARFLLALPLPAAWRSHNNPERLRSSSRR